MRIWRGGTLRTTDAAGAYVPATIVGAATGVAATDTAAVAAKITAAGVGATLYFPDGTYVVSGLVPLSGQTWRGGPNAILQRPSGGSAQWVIRATATVSDFTVRDLTIDGNRSGATGGNPAVSLFQPTRCRFDRVLFQNTPSTDAALELRAATECSVDRCAFRSVGYGVLIGQVGTETTSKSYGNTITGCSVVGTDKDAFFLTENLGSTVGLTVLGNVIGTVVADCTFRNVGDTAIEVGSGSVSTVVSGCSVFGASDGTGYNGVLVRDAKNTVVNGLTVRGLTSAAGAGVQVWFLNDKATGVSIGDLDVQGCTFGILATGPVSDLTISGGTIDAATSDGVRLDNITGFTITGLTVRISGGHGVSVGKSGVSGCTDGTITGLRSMNNGQSNTGRAGVVVYMTSDNITVTGGRMGDTQGTKTQGYGVRISDSTVTNVNVNGVNLRGNLTAAVLNASSAANGIRVRNCPGWNPQGMLSLTLPSAAPYTYTAGITPEVVYFSGGSGISMTKDSLAIPYNASGIGYALEPGESVTLTAATTFPTYHRTDRK